MIVRMASTPQRRRERRTRRANTGGIHAILQARVNLDVKQLADAGAAARGVTLSRYIQSLIEADEVAQAFLEQERRQGELDLQEVQRAS
jgi:hypothetical protein